MGIDAGFDMVPRLSPSEADRKSWAQFIHVVKAHYRDDTQVEIKPNYILFKVGEHPSLPLEGHKLLRFSSKVSGRSQAQEYIDTVARFARTHFGSRVQYWHEASDSFGKYEWAEVHESIRSYEKVSHISIFAQACLDRHLRFLLQVDQPENNIAIGSLSTRDHQVSNTDNPIFEVKDIVGKGRGLLACVDISMGT